MGGQGPGHAPLHVHALLRPSASPRHADDPRRLRREPKFLVLEHVTPATRLMEKRRQMFEVQETLEAQKSEFAHKEDIFKARRETGVNYMCLAC